MHAKIREKQEKIYKAILIAKICTQKFKKQIMKKMYDAFIFFHILIIFMLLQDIGLLLTIL